MPVSRPFRPSENRALPGASSTVDNGGVAKDFLERERRGSSGGKSDMISSNTKSYRLTSSPSAPITRAVNASSVGGGGSDGGNGGGSSGVNVPVASTGEGGQGVKGELVGNNNGFIGDNTGWYGTGYGMYGGGYGGGYGGYYGGR